MFIDAPITSLTVNPRAENELGREVIHAFSGYPVANVGDAMDRLNLMDTGIRAQWASKSSVLGRL